MILNNYIENTITNWDESMSGYYSPYENINEMKKIKEEAEVLRKYEMLAIILKKVERLKKYAIENKLSEETVLDSFLSKEELNILLGKEVIEQAVFIITKEKEDKQKQKKKEMRNYSKKTLYYPIGIRDDSNNSTAGTAIKQWWKNSKKIFNSINK